jgi:hypothetical protein
LLNKLRKVLVLIGVLLYVGSVCTGQQVNPFDIKSRIITIEQPASESIPAWDKEVNADTSSHEEKDSISPTFVNDDQYDSLNVGASNPFNVSPSDSAGSEKALTETETGQEMPEKLDVPDVPEQEKANTRIFVFWILLFTIIILASILNLKRNSFSNLYRSISNENYLRLIQREENNGFSALFIILNGLFYINGGLFIYLAFANFGMEEDFNFFALASFALFLLYMGRSLGMAFLSYVFPISKAVNQYNFTIILYNNFIGILLIVFNLIIAYSPPGISSVFLYTGFVMVGLFYLLRIFRGFLNSASFISNHLFHFFLYLCTFEIATVFILIKGVRIWIS